MQLLATFLDSPERPDGTLRLHELKGSLFTSVVVGQSTDDDQGFSNYRRVIYAKSMQSDLSDRGGALSPIEN